MAKIDAVSIVEDFWKCVWQSRNAEAIDRFVVEDFVITSDGVEIRSREKFKEWVASFLEKINDFDFEGSLNFLAGVESRGGMFLEFKTATYASPGVKIAIGYNF